MVLVLILLCISAGVITVDPGMQVSLMGQEELSKLKRDTALT